MTDNDVRNILPLDSFRGAFPQTDLDPTSSFLLACLPVFVLSAACYPLLLTYLVSPSGKPPPSPSFKEADREMLRCIFAGLRLKRRRWLRTPDDLPKSRDPLTAPPSIADASPIPERNQPPTPSTPHVTPATPKPPAITAPPTQLVPLWPPTILPAERNPAPPARQDAPPAVPPPLRRPSVKPLPIRDERNRPPSAPSSSRAPSELSGRLTAQPTVRPGVSSTDVNRLQSAPSMFSSSSRLGARPTVRPIPRSGSNSKPTTVETFAEARDLRDLRDLRVAPTTLATDLAVVPRVSTRGPRRRPWARIPKLPLPCALFGARGGMHDAPRENCPVLHPVETPRNLATGGYAANNADRRKLASDLRLSSAMVNECVSRFEVGIAVGWRPGRLGLGLSDWMMSGSTPPADSGLLSGWFRSSKPHRPVSPV